MELNYIHLLARSLCVYFFIYLLTLIFMNHNHQHANIFFVKTEWDWRVSVIKFKYEGIETRPADKDLGVKSWMWGGNVHSQPRKPIVFWAASGEGWPAGQGRSTTPSWDSTCGTFSTCGVLNKSSTWNCWIGSRGKMVQKNGPQKWSVWNMSPKETGWKTWGCPARRSEGSREMLEQPFSTWRGLIGKIF